MERAGTDEATDEVRAAFAAPRVTDLAILTRVAERLRRGMAGVDPLSRHEQLERPAAALDRRTVTRLCWARR